MIEMLVATAATMIMILFLNQIFTSLSNATSMGKGTSVIIQNARVIQPQIEADADAMLKPDQNGVLVITNKLIKGDLNGDGTIDTSKGEWGYRLAPNSTRPVAPGMRMDQVMWFRNVGGEAPRGPGNGDFLDNQTTALYARVWYGHGRRTETSGLDGGGLGVAGGPNEFIRDMVLCRQLLFLDPGAAMRTLHGSATPNSWFSDGVDRLSPVYDAGSGNQITISDGTNNQDVELFHGVIDVANRDLAGETNLTGLVSNTTPQPATETSGVIANHHVLFVSDAPQDTSPTDWGYWHRTLRFMYIFGRLRVNPAVTTDYQVQNWQLGQMHPLLADHVVDFEIEFAGDYINGLTGPPGSDLTIRTPGSDGNLDLWDDGTTIWYGWGVFPPASPASAPPAGAFATQNSPTTDPNPIFVEDPSLPPATVQGVDRIYVFRHGTPAVNRNWPYLIRFRYRLIDAQGRLTGADGRPGKVFEQIIAVNRN